MKHFKFDKIVRDKVTQLLKENNIDYKQVILTKSDLIKKFKLKLIEEADEVNEANTEEDTISEIADVLEVIEGMVNALGIDYKKIKEAKERKLKRRGGFEKGVFIEYVSSEDNNPHISYFLDNPDKYPQKHFDY